MKKNKWLILAGTLFLLAMSVTACKSTPPAEPAPVPEPVAAPVENIVQSVTPPASKPVDDALTALRDRMEALRNDCLKYKLDVYKADEWVLAETARAAGLKAYGVDYDIAKKSFEEAISRYEGIHKTAMAQLAAELEDSIKDARAAAVAAGADVYYPDQFALADSAAEEALSLRDAADLAGGYDVGQKALLRYQTLTKGMEAVALKQKIDRNQFEQYASGEYAEAGVKYDEAAAAYGSADAAALESASSSVVLYKKVNNAGFKVLSDQMVMKTDEIRALCDAIKASRSMPEPYKAAQTLYDGADASGKADDWESAYEQYSDATIAFTAVFQEVTLKRNAADVAIAAAKSRQDESTELAAKADELAPLPENAEGYSEEPVIIEETATGEETK